MWQYNQTPESDELYHHGVKGMQWGKRRFQNQDGSLTPAGKKRYTKLEKKLNKNIQRQTKADNKILDARAKNRSKLESKYNKWIGTITDSRLRKNEMVKKKAALEDFDIGTDTIKKAQKIGNENHNKIVELKMKAVSDPSIKNSESYKQAKRWCSAQVQSELLYGKTMTLFQESSAVIDGRSWTRSKLED